MGEYVLTLLAAAAVTYLLTPAVRRLAVAVGAVHAPRDRDVHVVPTPLLGGFAMYAGLATGLLVASRIPAEQGGGHHVDVTVTGSVQGTYRNREAANRRRQEVGHCSGR